MKRTVQGLTLAAAVSAAMMAAPAMAYEAGDWVVRGGATMVDPDASSNAVKANGGATDLRVDVDDDTQLGLTVTYMLSNRRGIEVMAATPFKHTVTTDEGTVVPVGTEVGETKHLPPTVSAVYYFSDSQFQPYVGAGINYTTFFSEDSSVGGDMKLDDSWGLALQAGADYHINENLHINASVRWIDIETDATIKGTALGADLDVTVEIDPMVYSIMVGYTF